MYNTNMNFGIAFLLLEYVPIVPVLGFIGLLVWEAFKSPLKYCDKGHKLEQYGIELYCPTCD